MIKDNVAHVKMENVFLQPVFQILKEPTDNVCGESMLRERGMVSEGLNTDLKAISCKSLHLSLTSLTSGSFEKSHCLS